MKKLLLFAAIIGSLSAKCQTSFVERDNFANSDSLKKRVSWAVGLVASNYNGDTTAKGWMADWANTAQKEEVWLLAMTRYVVQQAGGSASVSDAAILSSVTSYYPTFSAMMRRKIIGK